MASRELSHSFLGSLISAIFVRLMSDNFWLSGINLDYWLWVRLPAVIYDFSMLAIVVPHDLDMFFLMKYFLVEELIFTWYSLLCCFGF